MRNFFKVEKVIADNFNIIKDMRSSIEEPAIRADAKRSLFGPGMISTNRLLSRIPNHSGCRKVAMFVALFSKLRKLFGIL
jgi:hypothetical protein